MRKILFRGKPKTDLIDWIYGCYFWSELSGKHYIMGVSKDYGYTNIEVIPETVGQYTGLKDKNDKGIFEGDILTYPHAEEETIVEFANDVSGFRVIPNTSNAPYVQHWTWLHNVARYAEIIGNIHDTPELLEAEE